jgi:hypothetical protein
MNQPIFLSVSGDNLPLVLDNLNQQDNVHYFANSITISIIFVVLLNLFS